MLMTIIAGVQVTHGISWHGMAINCSVDLSYFQYITACGLVGRGITSLTEILGRFGKLVLHYCGSTLDIYDIVSAS